MKSLVFALAIFLSASAFATNHVSIVCDDDGHWATLIEGTTKAQQDEAANSPVNETASYSGDLVLSTWDKDEGESANAYDCNLSKEDSNSFMNGYVCSQEMYSGYKKFGLPKQLPAKGQSFKVPFVDVMFETHSSIFGDKTEKKVVKSVSICAVK